MEKIECNFIRFLEDLKTLRSFGASGSGVARVAFSDADIASRRWLSKRMQDAGLDAVVDSCGNLFGIPPGSGPCVLVGSHSDTQPLGGWLDGAYGVICGLELARAALICGGPRVTVVSFQDEEGRFGGLTGCSVWSGTASLDEVDSFVDVDGVTFKEARTRAVEIGQIGSVSPDQFSVFLEAHIEQGPVLDTANESIGVVEAIVGMRVLQIKLKGEANHAGTTPMHLRRDAFKCLAKIVGCLENEFDGTATPTTVWTIGRVDIEPNAQSIVPGAVSFSLEIRDSSMPRLSAMVDKAVMVIRQIADEASIDADIFEGAGIDPVAMDSNWTNRLAESAERVAPNRWRHMPSGALHDASRVSEVMPCAMLFVPSLGGISHNPAEDTREEDLAPGLEILAQVLSKI